jgi:hypothetical protein
MSLVLHFIPSLACLLVAIVVLARYLPPQNVAFIILFLVVMEAAFDTWFEAWSLPNGAAFWPAAIILLRAATQKFMQPWRRSKYYGLWVIVLTSGARSAMPFVRNSADMGLRRFLMTAACLIFLAPWFIQKRVTTSVEPRR